MLYPPIKLLCLTRNLPHALSLRPNRKALATFCKTYDLPRISRLRFDATLQACAKFDWELRGELSCTLKQTCALTLEPLETRLTETVRRLFCHDFKSTSSDAPADIQLTTEMDTDKEPLREEIALDDILYEAILLALPAFPRKQTAEFNDAFAEEPHPVRPNPFEMLKGHFGT